MRWSPIFKRIQEEAETRTCFFVTNSERLKNLLLHVLAMNPDRPRTKLQSIHRQIVAVGADAGWVGEQVGHVVLVRRGEWVVRGHPFGRRQIVFEHGEI